MGTHVEDLVALDLLDRIGLASDLRGKVIGPDILRRWSMSYVDGIEVTQGIQYYKAARHLTNADDRGEDNSVRLVAFKPAWARVYVRSGLIGASQNVTGELLIERRGTFPLWETVGTLTPLAPGNVPTQGDPDYAVERSTLASTLNFIIPQEMMWGVMRVTARIWRQGESAASLIDTHTSNLDVTLWQTLRLRGIMISYNGPDPTVNQTNPPNINLAAPALADMQETAAWTLTTNPVASLGAFSSAGNLQWGTALTGTATSPGGCSSQWLLLNASVAQVKTNDGNRTDVIYYGLLPAGTPIANVAGCESSGVSTGSDGDQVTMAHEIGHGAGLQHGPCGTPGDPLYPAYEPYDAANTPSASLGEYGLDINDGTIHPPAEKDYMSYCWPKWISLFHHARLINNAKFSPQTVGTSQWRPRVPILVDQFLWPWEYIPDPPEWERYLGDVRMKAQKVISIIGVVNEEREMRVQSVMRVTALPTVTEGVETPFIAQLIGKDGKVVASAPVMQLDARGHGCDCGHDGHGKYNERRPFAFQALISDVEPGAALRIVRRGREDEADKEVWTRRAPGQEPRISGFNVRVANEQGLASWAARGEPGMDFSLQFSKDEGKSWNSLAVNVRGDSYEFKLVDLPSGNLIFRLLAHDGFYTSRMETKPVKIPKRAPTISILYPRPGQPLIAERSMRLWAAISTTTGERIDPKSARWLIDGKDVASGPDAWTTSPKSGEHRCTLIVEDQSGRSEVSLKFTTIDQRRLNESMEEGPGKPSPTRKASARKPRKSAR
jgi:hypothetical protein